MTYRDVYNMVKKAGIYQHLVQHDQKGNLITKPVTEKKLRLSKQQATQLLAAILKEYKQYGQEYGLGKDRNLYLAGVTRYDKDQAFPQFYPDIRDKKDPKFRYDKAVGHYVSWQPGTDYLQYNG